VKVFAQVALCRGFQYMASYLSKVTNLHTKRVFGAPPVRGYPIGISPRSLAWQVICQKTKIFHTYVYLAPPLGMTPLELYRDLWRR